jgi:AraC-like DNA-binding protein
MDLHILPGVKARDVAEAHRRDLLIQNDHRCNCMTYWIDEKRGNVFCLIEAPGKEAVQEMHRLAHGLIPHRIIEVNDTLVESFLGRISDPGDAVVDSDGLKVFADPSFRTLLLIESHDPVLLAHEAGNDKAKEVLHTQRYIIRNELANHSGNEAEHDRHAFIASFHSSSKALACAIQIKKQLSRSGKNSGIRMSLHAGEPIANTEKLFGDTIEFGWRMCSIAKPNQILMSSAVRDLVSKDLQDMDEPVKALNQSEERLLEVLFDTLEKNWQDPEFNVAEYGQSLAMSASQVYRKTIALTGYSPNALLKEYRLEKARELMKKKPYNIAQITFDSGFSSPSYFTKCFKKKYGILPLTYLEMAKNA